MSGAISTAICASVRRKARYAGDIRLLTAIVAALFVAAPVRAQSVDIFSEFQRPDPFGGIVAADRALAPREILSPAMARGAHLVLHVAVSVPPGEDYLLYVSPNPTNACQVALYKEHFERTPAGWIPDRLQELHRLPDFGAMPDPDDHIDAQTTRAYLLDLWVAPDAPVGRFRVEVQLKMGDWVVRPMEVRVMEAHLAPDVAAGSASGAASVSRPLPPVEDGADAMALESLADDAAGSLGAPPPLTTVRAVIRRDTLEDMRLASALPQDAAGPPALWQRAFDLMRNNLAFTPRIFGAEWYLRIRDFLYAQSK